jgi:hypothetical protein
MTGHRLAALLTAALLGLAPVIAAAQQAYDPMAAARGTPALPGATTGQTAAPQGDPDYDYLPRGPGMEDTYYQCVACHSTAIIRQQRLTDARWDYLWTWMIKEQGMQDADPEVRETILSYLKTHFSAER